MSAHGLNQQGSLTSTSAEPAAPVNETSDAQPSAETVPDESKDKLDPSKQDDNENDQPEGEKKGPAGGYDATPIPKAPPGYTVRITFHRAEQLPMADLATLSSDPYIQAELRTSLQTRHKEDPNLRFRTHTIWRSTKPEWDEDWIIAHVPADGFKLKLRIYDEDSTDRDDRLGNVHINVDSISDKWEGIHNQKFRILKRSGSWRAYLLRAIAVGTKQVHHMHGSMFVSIEVLGKSEGNDGGRAYTVGRNYWCKHYSPLLGRITGTKAGEGDHTEFRQPTGEGDHGRAEEKLIGGEGHAGAKDMDASETRRMGGSQDQNPELAENNLNKGTLAKVVKKEQQHKEKKKTKSTSQQYNFQANQIQLTGPIPPELYHRFVEFRPFIKSLFTKSGIRGNIMASALHAQHMHVYNFNRDTRYGVFDEPCRDMTLKFLELCHFDTGGRIFTYVLTLDALLRFTETGKEFGIDMLSKHTMHSNADIYISFSGEFFIRRLKHKYDPERDEQGRDAKGTPTATADPSESQPPADPDGETTKSAPPLDPAYYELIIDNDSGTYRPNAKTLPLLRKFLQKNFPGLKISTLDCQGDEKLMGKLKDGQRAQKKKEQGGQRVVYTQLNASDSSLSSSDEERLDDLVEQDGATNAEENGNGEGGMQQTHKLGEAVAPLVGNHPHVRKGLGEKPVAAA